MVAALKRVIWEKGCNVPINQQRLLCTAFELEDTRQLADYECRATVFDASDEAPRCQLVGSIIQPGVVQH